MMKLSKRLQLIADMISQYKQGSKIADIGTDHAYLPCYLVENNIVSHSYACDVAQGPYESSLSTIKQCGMQTQVTALLGNGLEPILDKKVDMISIAGMGSYLIVDILNQHLDYLNQVNVLFLQPNANADYLRKYLFGHNFGMIDEKLIKDGHHTYEVMVVRKLQRKDIYYNELDEEFGPILRREQTSLFKEKWNNQYCTYKNIVKDLPNNHPRTKELNHKIEMIEEVLNESK